jgi:hypothetical protein
LSVSGFFVHHGREGRLARIELAERKAVEGVALGEDPVSAPPFGVTRTDPIFAARIAMIASATVSPRRGSTLARRPIDLDRLLESRLVERLGLPLAERVE